MRVKLAGEVKLNGRNGPDHLDVREHPAGTLRRLRTGILRRSARVDRNAGSVRELQTTGVIYTMVGRRTVDALSEAGEFTITSGPGGSPCADPRPFTPSVQAGSTNLQAGGFSSFTLQITNPDHDQALTGVVAAPTPGRRGDALVGRAVSANRKPRWGRVGLQSEIGQASASVGFGPDPYTVRGGRVYLTGPYGGAPFGLSIVTPAVAGPFNLGNVVVRSAITSIRTPRRSRSPARFPRSSRASGWRPRASR